MPSTAETTNSAASAARRPARSSPTKSAYPGVSSRLIFTPSCSSGAQESATERCCRTAAGSWSETVVPSTTEPARLIVPVAASSASTSVVFPEPEWPTSTTLRTLPGSVTTGAAAPVSPFSCVFCAMTPPVGGTSVLPGCYERCWLNPTPAGVGRRNPSCRSVGRAAGVRRSPCAAADRVGRPWRRSSAGPPGRRLVLRRQPDRAVLLRAGRHAERGHRRGHGRRADRLAIFGARGHLCLRPRGSSPRRALTDVLDGTMARMRGGSGRFGALLDSTMDRVADGAIFGAVAY